MSVIPRPPGPDAELAGANANETMLAFLNTRRSCPAPALGAPGPNHDEVQALLRLAARVPDHRRLAP